MGVGFVIRHHPGPRGMQCGLLQEIAQLLNRGHVQRGKGLVDAGDGRAAGQQTHQPHFSTGARGQHEETFVQMFFQLQGLREFMLQFMIPRRAVVL